MNHLNYKNHKTTNLSQDSTDNYILKFIPEDFIVEEILDLKTAKIGRYSYFLLQKTNITTHNAISIISNRLNIPKQRINYSGIKDKRAVTKQYISINSLPYNLRRDFSFDNIELKYLGQGNERINLGSHSANLFKIIVRNLDKKINFNTIHFPNYFGSQRFSSNNWEIGKLIIQKNYDDAVNLINETEKKYKIESNNPISSLQSLPKGILRLYLHSFQSYLWNIATSTFLKHYLDRYNIPYKTIEKKAMTLIYPQEDVNMLIGFPLVGFDFEEYISDYRKKLAPEFIDHFNLSIKLIEETLEFYGISERDFILRSLPNMTLETSMRSAISKMDNFEYIWGEDEYHLNRKKVLVKFMLEKSSYATIAIESLFG